MAWIALSYPSFPQFLGTCSLVCCLYFPLTGEFLEVTAQKQPIHLMSGGLRHYCVSCRHNSGRGYLCDSASPIQPQEAVHPCHISLQDPLQRSKCPFRHLAAFTPRPAHQICMDFRKAAQNEE